MIRRRSNSATRMTRPASTTSASPSTSRIRSAPSARSTPTLRTTPAAAPSSRASRCAPAAGAARSVKKWAAVSATAAHRAYGLLAGDHMLQGLLPRDQHPGEDADGRAKADRLPRIVLDVDMGLLCRDPGARQHAVLQFQQIGLGRAQRLLELRLGVGHAVGALFARIEQPVVDVADDALQVSHQLFTRVGAGRLLVGGAAGVDAAGLAVGAGLVHGWPHLSGGNARGLASVDAVRAAALCRLNRPRWSGAARSRARYRRRSPRRASCCGGRL